MSISQQIPFIPIVGISQLIFISQISRNLSENSYINALLVLNLSSLLTFLDFGLIFSFFYLMNSARLNSEVSAEIEYKIAKLSLRLAFIELSFGVLLQIFELQKSFAIYLCLFALNLPGLLNLIHLRVKNKPITYLILFNLSWPLSATMTLLFRSQLRQLGYLTGFLPLFVSTIINSIYLYKTRKTNLYRTVLARKLSLSDSATFSKRFIASSFLSTSIFSIISQSDKYLAAGVSNKSELALFLTYSQILNGLLAVMNVSYLYTNLGKYSGKESKILTAIFPSIFIGILYLITSSIFVQYFSGGMKNSSKFLVTGFFILVLNGFLFATSAKFSLRGRPNLRIIGQIVQLSILSVGVFLFWNWESLLCLQLIYSASIIVNIVTCQILLHSKYSAHLSQESE